MSEAPENPVIAMLRRLDSKMDRLIDDVQDLKHCMTSVEGQLGEVRVDLAGVSGRLDRMEIRVERIERRLDLVVGQSGMTARGFAEGLNLATKQRVRA